MLIQKVPTRSYPVLQDGPARARLTVKRSNSGPGEPGPKVRVPKIIFLQKESETVQNQTEYRASSVGYNTGYRPYAT